MTPAHVLALSVSLVLGGCAPLLTGTGNVPDALKVMQEQNARGCIYVRASAQPWASAGLLLVGTWGSDPPAYEQCWQGLPSGAP